MCLNNNSILQLKNGIIHAGSVFNFLNNSKLQINGGSNILFNGTNSSHIFLQFGSNNKNFLLPDDPTSIIFNYTDVSNVIVSNMTKSSTTIGTTSGNLLFNNCTFRNTSNQSDLINISVKEKEFNSSSTNILDIYFNDCLFYKSYAGSCVTIDNAHKVSIKGTSFGYENEATFDNSTGLMITNSGELIIESCIFTKLPNSIAYLNPVITPSSKISTIENNYFNEGVQTAISVINSPSILIKNNSFNDCNKAVTLNHVDDALIFDNNIHKENCFGTGVDLISCGGILYQNNIRGYYIAVSLAMSSPQMGKNVISHNSGTGLYIGPGSFPFLSESYIENSGNYIEYPIAGYNTFFENGIGQNEFNGSEIYISGGSILLDKGCNSIYDDRTQNEYEYLQLISGERNVDISASTNYWGNHPYFGNDPSGRFFTDGNVYFEPYLIEPCIILPLGLQSLVFKSSAGDTIEQFEATGIINSADQRTILRSKALTEYFDGDYFNSFIFANQYSANYINTELDFPNLQNLLMLKKRITSEGFNELLDFYNQSYNNTNDSLLMYILKNLENQTNIASKNYNSALNGYIQIAETNPGNERGYYALIDAITTSFLNSDSTAGFGKLGKYHAANGSELLLILNNLLGKKDHLNSASSILPTEFHLFQNYPNPFNPVTRIVFDVPNTSNVTLEVYDLLGRQVATLINEVKEQGRYTVQFNASSLASGVYIYQMKAGKYVSTQKMLLLK